ncbi:hypothetical protein B566_EDAN009806 [Ephemera danica]|nr:hypothetical protein B566_EDAN009806 [Ephemera danica]
MLVASRSKIEAKKHKILLNLKCFHRNLNKFKNATQAYKTEFNQIKQKFNASVTARVPLKFGKLLPKCGKKQYFVSDVNFRIEFSKLFEKCCEIGATPAFFNDKAELECLKQEMKNGATDFTFRVNGHAKSNRIFFTCPGFRTISDEFWARGQPDNAKNMEDCVALNLKQVVGLHDVHCLMVYRYICQVMVVYILGET